MNIIRDLQFPTILKLKNQNWKLSENRFQELVQNCFKSKTEDSFEDLEMIISKAKKYS